MLMHADPGVNKIPSGTEDGGNKIPIVAVPGVKEMFHLIHVSWAILNTTNS